MIRYSSELSQNHLTVWVWGLISDQWSDYISLDILDGDHFSGGQSTGLTVHARLAESSKLPLNIGEDCDGLLYFNHGYVWPLFKPHI